MNYQDYINAVEEADRRMKAKNGHQYVTILKTRCEHCGASPKRKTRCPGWFQTWVNLLGVVLQEKGVIQAEARELAADLSTTARIHRLLGEPE